MEARAPRILIIESDVPLNQQLADLLADRGFSIHSSHDGEQGLLSALSDKFDLILLDVLLPTMDGFSVLNKLRKSKHTPVMMLSASASEEERIQSYASGADDYLPKPLNFTELVLRVEALLRRSLGLMQPQAQLNALTVDALSVNRNQQSVYYDGHSISLTPIQFKLLWTLLENHNEVLTKPYLYQSVLEREFSRYDRSLDMHLSRVRRKLMDAGMPADRLATVHGKGYCFN